jgi:hypothetical protein
LICYHYSFPSNFSEVGANAPAWLEPALTLLKNELRTELLEAIEEAKDEIIGALEDLRDETQGVQLSLEDFRDKTEETLGEIDENLTSIQRHGAIVCSSLLILSSTLISGSGEFQHEGL